MNTPTKKLNTPVIFLFLVISIFSYFQYSQFLKIENEITENKLGIAKIQMIDALLQFQAELPDQSLKINIEKIKEPHTLGELVNNATNAGELVLNWRHANSKNSEFNASVPLSQKMVYANVIYANANFFRVAEQLKKFTNQDLYY